MPDSDSHADVTACRMQIIESHRAELRMLDDMSRGDSVPDFVQARRQTVEAYIAYLSAAIEAAELQGEKPAAVPN